MAAPLVNSANLWRSGAVLGEHIVCTQRDGNRFLLFLSCHRDFYGGFRSAQFERQTGNDSGKGRQLGESCSLHGAETIRL